MEVRIPCADGFTLGGLLFVSDRRDPCRVLLVCGAIGVPCSFYKRFASFAASRMGYTCSCLPVSLSLPLYVSE